MSIQQWHSLQPEARATWDLLSDEAKAIILGLRKDPGKRTVNLHNISAYDFLQANMHDLQLDDMEDVKQWVWDPILDDDEDDKEERIMQEKQGKMTKIRKREKKESFGENEN